MQNAIPDVKKIIVMASGKGGVGKSTTAVNIALALAAQGHKIGLLDADIYGPSQPRMLGISGDQRPHVIEEKIFLPIDAHGLKVMSMGFLVDEQAPMIWRGPMASNALQQLLFQTRWGELDCLIIDMPPGTGDIHLTLSQRVALNGAVIVTTPQDIALLDARKGIEMFHKVSVPTLGLIENMSTHICSNCGHEESVFGFGGGDKLAREYNVPLLGQLPLALSICMQTDSGLPPVIAEPESEVARHYKTIGQKIVDALSSQTVQMPRITIKED